MKQQTITIQSIVEAEFANVNINEIISQLKDHHLYDFIIKSLEQINEHIKLKKNSIKTNGILNIAPIGVIMLVKFNEYFRNLIQGEKCEEKEKLEYLLGNFMKRLLINVIKAVPKKEKQAQLQHIVVGLIDACKLHNYDFEKLSKFLNTDDMVLEFYAHLPNSESISNSTSNQLPGLIMKHDSPEALSLLINILKNEGITEEYNKFIELFNHPKENLAITFNQINKIHVLQFLVVLKNSGIVSFHHCGGFYQVFSCHVKNFDEVFLHGKTPQKRIDAVRKLKDWFSKEEHFENQLRQIVKLRHSA
ncbi:MAG: hypothetical protein IM592_13740 [Bacteroidetes bacterium]|nr:hypothetical protein [Bacteroidota bacterium]